MTDHLSAVRELDEPMRTCIADAAASQELCLAAVQHCLKTGGEHASAKLIGALLDCAQACGTARDFMLRASKLHPGYCRGCAHACGSCASACERFADDKVLQACAEACRQCMQSCRLMGGEDRHRH